MQKLYCKVAFIWFALFGMHSVLASTLNCANQAPVDARYFGMHIHRFHDPKMIPTVEFGSWRLWDAGVSWNYLQPSRDAWDFRRLELALSIAEKRKVEIGLVLGMTPNWASARPVEHSHGGDGAAAEPRDFADWDNYVRTVALRYKGRIQFYEIWNEPDTTAFYTGTVPQMVELARRAHQIIKSVDPKAIVVSPSPSKVSSLPWFTQFARAGGLKYADVVGYHFYTNSKIPEDLITFVGAVRSVLSQHGIDKPLWNTEAGVVNDGTPNSGLQIGPAAHVGRWLILGTCLGLKRFHYYSWDNERLGLFDINNLTARSQAIIYQTTRKWLVESVVEKCVIGTSWSYCAIVNNNIRNWIVWAESSSTLGDAGGASKIEDGSGFVIYNPSDVLQLVSIPMLVYKK